MNYLLIAVCSYLLGSVPFSYLIGKKIYGSDIRTKGSKNPGATNAYRSFGLNAGILTLILDFLKGILAVYIGKLLGGFNGELVALVLTPIGHIYSCFLHFKGGKGVATCGGVFLAVNPKAALILLVVFLVVFLTSRIVSLSSIVTAFLSPFVVLLFYGISPFFFCQAFLAALVIYKHRQNIERLRNKTEKKLF